MMATFREFLIAEALDTKKKKNGKESKYSDMKVKTDKELADDTTKIKQYSDQSVKTDKELASTSSKIKT